MAYKIGDMFFDGFEIITIISSSPNTFKIQNNYNGLYFLCSEYYLNNSIQIKTSELVNILFKVS